MEATDHRQPHLAYPMEVTQHDRPHLALLKALLNPYLLVLASYLSVVAVQLVVVTRLALMDDLVQVTTKRASQKRYLAMAVMSLAATWYYMFSYLFWSYSAYLDRVQLTGSILTTIPDCKDGLKCLELVTSAKLMRLSSWLRDTTLFEEAWLHVVTGKLNWWWSVEICSFAVGFWALQTRQESKRYMIPHVWAYVLLGQSVAISVSMNLFNLARDTRSVPVYFVTEDGLDDRSVVSPSLQRTISQQEMPPPTSPTAKTAKKIQQRLLLVSPPRFADMALCAVATLAGLTSVLLVPSDLLSILAMHLCPLLMVLPLKLPSKVVPRQWRTTLSYSTVYTIVAAYSFLIKIKAHWDVWPQIRLLPATFIAHPAQSSISADFVCVTVSAMVELMMREQQQDGPKISTSMTRFLFFLTPLVGPSTTMAALYAMESKQIEQEEIEKVWQAVDSDADLQGKDIIMTTTVTTTAHQLSVSAGPSKKRVVANDDVDA